MATATKNVYPHVSKDPAVCSGRACVSGTRVRIMDVVALHSSGLNPLEIVQELPSLESEVSVYAALVYYNDHRTEIDGDFVEDARLAAAAERDRLSRTRS